MADSKQGQIVTFYSFKGGVGRSMSLANVAFLAAMNDLRVLVMDWDLEAPGLHYYFRGLMEPKELRNLGDRPGILNLAWDWLNGFDLCTTDDDTKSLVASFRDGEPFAKCVTKIPVGDKDQNRTIDIISAGSNYIDTQEPESYEQALSKISWPSFFEEKAGGFLISNLREWAKRSYDLVLIDSRTGLADVAGVCTVQLPDVVVLCFVLNRQNIEGVAKVASAIRANRDDNVGIRSAIMRLARENTLEESDARARAKRELTRVGGLLPEDVEQDFRKLAVRAAPNVPFYENLAVFNDDNPHRDQLTLDYAQLTQEICRRPIQIPPMESEYRNLVRSRLSPREPSTEYLNELIEAEPLRAAEELAEFFTRAVEDIINDEIPEEAYLLALVNTTLYLYQDTNPEDTPLFNEAVDSALEMLRVLYDMDPTRWGLHLVDALERTIEEKTFFRSSQEELFDLEEIEFVLSRRDQEYEILLRRLNTKRKMARIYGSMGDHNAEMISANEILDIIEVVELNHPDHDVEILLLAQADAIFLRAEAKYASDKHGAVISDYETVLSLLKTCKNDDVAPEAQRLQIDAHLRLIQLLREQAKPDFSAIANHALEAIVLPPALSLSYIGRFEEFVRAVLESPDSSDSLKLVERAFGYQPERRIVHFVNYYGRSVHYATDLVKLFEQLCTKINQGSPITRKAQAFGTMAVILSDVVAIIKKRQTILISRRSPPEQMNIFAAHVERFLYVLRAEVGSVPPLERLDQEILGLSKPSS